jgi:cyclic beta-1,2-glucan synthetase
VGAHSAPHPENTSPYVARRGQGYSRFEHTSHGIVTNLLQFVPLDGPITISRLRLENHSNTRGRLSVTSYVE